MSHLPSTQRQAGFTLVELVIVILILGILSAVALPRFINLGGDARRAKAEGIFGAVRSSMQISRAGALVRGVDANATATLAVDGGNVDLVYGYPAATAAGILAAAGLNATNDKLTLNTSTPGTMVIQVNGAGTLADCSVTYTAATSATVAATATLGNLNNC